MFGGRKRQDGGWQSSTENFWGDGFVNYLECGDIFMGAYIYQDIKSHTLSKCNLLYVHSNKTVLKVVCVWFFFQSF